MLRPIVKIDSKTLLSALKESSSAATAELIALDEVCRCYFGDIYFDIAVKRRRLVEELEEMMGTHKQGTFTITFK